MSNTSATPQSGAVVGHKFFGPDFSLDAFKGNNHTLLPLRQITGTNFIIIIIFLLVIP